MERCAANHSFDALAVSVLLAGFTACAPALQDKAQLNFSVQKFGMRASGLSYNSGTLELPDDMCYAIHVTSFDNNPVLQRMTPSANDATCEHGPRGLGLLAGTFAKGSIAELEVPIGPRRRFDLVGVPKSIMPGGTCAAGLHAEIVGPPNTDNNVQIYLGATKFDEDESMRLIARGEVDITPGVVNVVLEAVAVDPKGLEYTCHQQQGSSGGDTVVSSGPPTSGPGSFSQPLVRSGTYLQVFLDSPDSSPPSATTHYFVNFNHQSTFHIGGSCSAIDSSVFVFIDSATAELPCTLSSTPFLNSFDNKYYVEGHFDGTIDLSGVADSSNPLNVTAHETVSGNTFTADDYTLIDSHAFIPLLYKDTLAPVVYAYTPTFYSTPSPHKVFSGMCESGLPVYIKTCAITGGSCPAPGLGETMASIPCTGSSFSLDILGSAVGGHITFMQIDEALNSSEYTSP